MSIKHIFEKKNSPHDESSIPVGNNRQVASERMFQADRYKESIPMGEDVYGPNLANLRDPLRVLYGKVDYQGMSVKPKLVYLRDIQYPSDNPKSCMVLDFVADLYEDMIKYVERLHLQDVLTEDTVYGHLHPKRAWANVDSLYSEYLELFKEQLMLSLTENAEKDREIARYEDFQKHFVLSARTVALNIPITKTEYSISKFSNRLSTGLTIDISDKSDASDDSEKFLGYVMDTDFANMRQIANRFGFRIDFNVPWRFHCDLNSPVVQERLRLRGVYSFVDFFNRFYEKVHVGYIDEMKEFIVNCYNEYVTMFPTYERLQICDGELKTVVFERFPAEQSAVDKLPKSNWYKIYAEIRMIERNKKMPKHAFKRMIQAAHDYDEELGGDIGENILEKNFIDRFDELSNDSLTRREMFGIIPSENTNNSY